MAQSFGGDSAKVGQGGLEILTHVPSLVLVEGKDMVVALRRTFSRKVFW